MDTPVSIHAPSLSTPAARVNPVILRRLAIALGSDGDTTAEIFPDPSDLLTLAAERIEKASRIMAQLHDLHLAAQKNGFIGDSAHLMLQFLNKKLTADADIAAKSPSMAVSKDSSEAIVKIASACESLDPELAFHEGYMDEDPQVLLNACLRVIGESASRINTQRTTIEMLAGPLAEKRFAKNGETDVFLPP